MEKTNQAERALEALKSATNAALLLGGIVLLSTVAIILAEVAVRKLFNATIQGVDEIAGYGMALSTGEVKFKGMVTPKTKLVEYGVDFKRVMRGRLVLGIADGWLKADGETIYTASDLKVGLSKEKAGA